MGVMGTLARLLGLLFDATMLVIIVNALLSWVRPDPSNPVVRFIDQVSDFFCNPIRRVVPTVFGGFDLAPMIVLVLLMLLRGIVMQVLVG